VSTNFDELCSTFVGVMVIDILAYFFESRYSNCKAYENDIMVVLVDIVVLVGVVCNICVSQCVVTPSFIELFYCSW